MRWILTLMIATGAAAAVAGGASGTAGAAAVPTETLSAEALRHWVRHLVPLPKRLELTQRVTLPASAVHVSIPMDPPELLQQAARELRAALGQPDRPTGGMPERPNHEGAAFTISLRVDPAASDLAAVPHADQAYLIRPTPAHDGLTLIGGGPLGAYYAAKTMQQFLAAGRRGDRVDIPLVRITDWPDLERRGLWGSDSASQLRWMSDRKLNFDEQIARNIVRPDRQPAVSLSGAKQRIIKQGPTLGIEPVPVVLHLEQLDGTGLFEAYPQLVAHQGKPGTVCYSDSTFVEVLAAWLVQWRETPGVQAVDVWMAENLGGQPGCQCQHCAREDRNVLEARAIVAAWRRAREKHPDLQLYTLTSEETEDSNPQVFRELPPEVRLWYYHSLFTYNVSESPMVRPYLVEEIRRGRWLGVCLNLDAAVGFNQPFTGAHFVHYRMNEFVDKGLGGFMGYATPRICAVRFNVEAAAEWSWNAKGRSPREFAASWAVREGLGDPEAFADWSEALGPVAWDIYGSEWPRGHKRKKPGPVATLLKEGNLPPLGSSINDGAFRMPWSDIRTPAQLRQNVAQASRALAIARGLGVESLIHESLVIQGHINALEALWELGQIVRDGQVAPADRPAARRWFRQYIEGLQQARNSLRAWEASVEACGGRRFGERGDSDTLATMIEEMQTLAAQLGCQP